MIVKSKLHNNDILNSDGYITSLLLYDFLEQVQTSQGLYSTKGEFCSDFSLRGVGPYGAGLFVQPT